LFENLLLLKELGSTFFLVSQPGQEFQGLKDYALLLAAQRFPDNEHYLVLHHVFDDQIEVLVELVLLTE